MTERTYSLLIVDDNAMNRDMLARRLDREGYRIATASGGRAALAHVAEQKFDLILLDILMPDMDGYQVLETLKADPATREIPVVMLTAVNEIDSVVRSFELGAEDYLTKPFNIPFVKSRIMACLRASQPVDAGAADDIAGANILIVDDNAMNRDMLARRLEREGYQITTASGGRAALELISNQPFDLVLLDILMPDLNGYQVLETLKSDPATRDMPVVMLTAVNEVDSLKSCIDLGAEDYLIKPFNALLLRSRIASILRSRQQDR
jgi:CheY-like chemotaxis protein